MPTAESHSSQRRRSRSLVVEPQSMQDADAPGPGHGIAWHRLREARRQLSFAKSSMEPNGEN